MELSLFSASASSSSNTTPLKYDVFLSFRGEDTRYNFTSHLYRALSDKNIETFIDYELRRGDEISPTLLKAIEDSQISIIIFSEGYASSRWCLEEVVKILECKEMYGQIVMPIFYKIDPTHVRHQTGSFAKAFAEHEQRFKESLHKVKRWKNALQEAANLSGLDSSVIKPESLLIETVVQDVLKRLNDLSSSDMNYLVGIDSRIQEIESLLCIGSKDVVRSVGLWGIGGIGKTTLAGAVYNKISCQFEGSHFIENVREESEQSGGLNHLRRELLSITLGDRNIHRGSSFAAGDFAKKRLNRRKLLLVFDDVTEFGQIEALMRGIDCFDFGIRIIITTRDIQVLKNCRVDHIYKVDKLCDGDALKLFCLYASGRNHPKENYEELSNRLVEYVGGVPLALKVLGSSLLDKTQEVWESAMNKLEEILDKDIYKILRISFEGLDENEKNIFLDIACFLKGRGINLVKDYLNACGFFTEAEISSLIDKSLITIVNNTLTMHDLLQAMGKEIVRQESITDPGKRSWLWHHKDIYSILTDNTGTETIEGISLDMSKIGHVHLNPLAFKKMSKLRFLKFDSSVRGRNANKVHVSDGLKSVFTKLRYLHWRGSPFQSLSSNFQSENLVFLDMQHSQVKQLWNGALQLVNLKQINLSRSKYLTICPDLSGAPNLLSLNLAATNLFEISSSIQHFNNLNYLNLSLCKKLRVLPDCSALKSLRKLHLSFCSNLKTLPELPCNIEVLKLIRSSIEELPSSFSYLSKLVMLDLSSSRKLKSLPDNISKLRSLKDLIVSHCSKLDKLPDAIGTLDSLRNFEAMGSAIREVPPSIIYLNNLEKLSFQRCKAGQDIAGLSLPPLSGLHSLRQLDLTNCAIIKIPDSLGSLSSLKELYLGRNNFESIPASIKNLSSLQYLDISYCEVLQSLPELPLICINAYNCISLEAISCLLVPHSVDSIDSSFIKVDLINCFKLDPNVLVEDVILKIQSLATLWKETYNDDEDLDISPPLCTLVCFPGNEVPKWFNFRSLGSSITMELPPGWLNDNFVGFALCAVVAFQDHKDNGSFLDIHFDCNFKSEDGLQEHLEK